MLHYASQQLPFAHWMIGPPPKPVIVRTFGSPEIMKASQSYSERFKTFNSKRNKWVFYVAAAISDEELEAITNLADDKGQHACSAAGVPTRAA